MKKVILAFIALSSSLTLWGQQQQQPSAPARVAPPPVAPQNPNAGTLPAAGAATAPNTPPAVQNQLPTATAAATNQFVVTNQLTPTGIPNFPQTNVISVSSTQTVNFSITNTLSRMAPTQATNVVRVQASLTALQNIALTIGGAQNVQNVVQQNPQVQQQLQQIAAQITALGQGPVKPSNEITIRLSSDLLRALAPVRLTPDRLLVLAIVINQASNSGNLTPVQVEDTINTGLATLQTAGVPLAFAHPVGCDLHAIAFELQPALAR